MYKLEYTSAFETDFNSLDKEIAGRIIRKLEWLQAHPEVLRFPLKNLSAELKNLQKYRLGNYRILLWVDHHQKALTLYAIEHRRSVYKDL